MLNSQRFAIKLSEARTRLNAINAMEDPSEYTEEVQAEETKLLAEHRGIEKRYQSAVTAEAAEEKAAKQRLQNGDLKPEESERLELRRKSSLSNYFSAAIERKSLDGAEKEFNESLKVALDRVPLDMLANPEDGQAEARAVTDAPSTTVVSQPRPAVPAAFVNSIAARLGVSMPQVSGVVAYPKVDTAPAGGGGFLAKGGTADATAGTISVATRKAKRIAGRLTLAAEDRAILPQIENILRPALVDQLNDALDAAILTGNGSSDNLSGLFQVATDVAVGSATITWSSWNGLLVALVDGVYATGLDEVSVIIGSDTYKVLDDLFLTNPGNYSAWDRARDKARTALVSNRMPAKASNGQKALVLKHGKPRAIELPTFNSLELLVDPYTGSGEGLVHITGTALFGDVFVPYGASQVVELHPKIS